jgi:hypothetical protein
MCQGFLGIKEPPPIQARGPELRKARLADLSRGPALGAVVRRLHGVFLESRVSRNESALATNQIPRIPFHENNNHIQRSVFFQNLFHTQPSFSRYALTTQL